MKAYAVLFALAVLVSWKSFDPGPLPPVHALQGLDRVRYPTSFSRNVAAGVGGWSLEDADWAAVTAIEEAPPEGRVAVLWVIRRRMRACGCSAEAVVRADLQFQPWRQGSKVRRMIRRLAVPDRETLEVAVLAARVLAGGIPDPTDGATHFHAEWAEPAWAPAMLRTATVAGSVFYRRPPKALIF
jgi:hypothetical protein